MGGGTSRQITIGSIQIPISEINKLVTLQITPSAGISIAAKAYSSYTSGTCVITTAGSTSGANTRTTADLYVGCPVWYVISGSTPTDLGTITSITNNSTFVVSNTTASLTAGGTFVFPSDDYMMYNKLGSSGFYQVPAGKTLYILAHYPNLHTGGSGAGIINVGITTGSGGVSDIPGIFGYATAPVVAETSGRIRTHNVPTGAVHYALSSTDYCYLPNSRQYAGAAGVAGTLYGANTISPIFSFPSGSYPFLKSNLAHHAGLSNIYSGTHGLINVTSIYGYISSTLIGIEV